jgi:hypothetical protein
MAGEKADQLAYLMAVAWAGGLADARVDPRVVSKADPLAVAKAFSKVAP